MHAQGEPKTMHLNPVYTDVVLEVFDYLEQRIEAAEAAGISRAKIAADPGVGFGKTMEHTLSLLANLSLFHGLGVPLLVGASRKRFIAGIDGGEQPKSREPGSWQSLSPQRHKETRFLGCMTWRPPAKGLRSGGLRRSALKIKANSHPGQPQIV
jgi:dihydropteroate synthase